MFEFCLAPDTNGDGTGCDNMTCIVVVFSDLLRPSVASDDAPQTATNKRKADDTDDAETEREPKQSREDADVAR